MRNTWPIKVRILIWCPQLKLVFAIKLDLSRMRWLRTRIIYHNEGNFEKQLEVVGGKRASWSWSYYPPQPHQYRMYGVRSSVLRYLTYRLSMHINQGAAWFCASHHVKAAEWQGGRNPLGTTRQSELKGNMEVRSGKKSRAIQLDYHDYVLLSSRKNTRYEAFLSQQLVDIKIQKRKILLLLTQDNCLYQKQ